MIKNKIFLKVLPFAVIILLSIVAAKGLFKYSFFSTHDGNHHIARIYDAIGTINEGHFPLRWGGSLNYFCGVPIYNFFYPLAYYLAVAIFPFAREVILTFKIELAMTLLASAIFFYLWIKEEVHDKWVALSSAILYLYAPYRFLNVYVRGDVGESIAYALLPLVLYFFALIFNAKIKKRVVFLGFLAAVAGGFLTISHNFTVMFVMPIILMYLLVKILTKGGLFNSVIAILAYISAFGLGAFFIFPALLEINNTQLTTPRFLYSDHFPTLAQLIHSKWDYFYSAPGTALDGMSFELGIAQWAVLIFGAIFLILGITKLISNKESHAKFIKNNLVIIFFFVLSMIFTGLMLQESDFVWKAIPLIQSIQFPWRLLGIAVFLLSALFPFIAVRIKIKFFYWVFVIGIAGLAIMGNRNHLLPQPVLDSDLKLWADFDNLHYERHSTTTFDDDIVAPNAEACWADTPPITTNNGPVKFEIVNRTNTSGTIKFGPDGSYKGDKLILGLGYFPGAYNIEMNGHKVPYADCYGRVCVDREKSTDYNLVTWKVIQTPVQSLFNKVSLIFLALWLIALGLSSGRLKFKWKYLVLIGIFALFAYFRFYNLDKRVGFGWDEERDAWAASSILAGDLKFIGPRVLGPEGFFLPPYFFYLLVPFYAVTNLHPSAIILFLLFSNAAFFIASYFIFRKAFNNKIALLFLLLWSVSPLAIAIDTVAWNPVLIPLMFVALFYFLLRYIETKALGFLLLIGLIFGLGVSFHFQFLLLTPMLLPFIFENRKPKEIITKTGWYLLGLVLPFFPLAIFDLKNNFLNSRLFLNLFSHSGPKDLLGILNVWGNVTGSILTTEYLIIPGIIFYLAVLVALYIAYKKQKKNKQIWQGIFLTWSAFPVFFVLYGKRPSEYYFNYLLPIFLLGLSYWVLRIFDNARIFIKIVLIASVALLVFLFINKSSIKLKENALGLYYKDKAIGFISEISKNKSPYNLSFSVGLNEDSGYRYLLLSDNATPSGNDKEPLMRIIVPPDNYANFIFGGVGLHVPPSWLKANWVKAGD